MDEREQRLILKCDTVIKALIGAADTVADEIPAFLEAREEPDELDDAAQLVAFVDAAMRAAYQTRQVQFSLAPEDDHDS